MRGAEVNSNPETKIKCQPLQVNSAPVVLGLIREAKCMISVGPWKGGATKYFGPTCCLSAELPIYPMNPQSQRAEIMWQTGEYYNSMVFHKHVNIYRLS